MKMNLAELSIDDITYLQAEMDKISFSRDQNNDLFNATIVK